MSIEELRLKLANLGVDLRPTKPYPSKRKYEEKSSISPEQRRRRRDASRRSSDSEDVMDLLEQSPTVPFREKSPKQISGPKCEIDLIKRLRRSEFPISTHSPLGSVLAQYKDAERNWAKEKVQDFQIGLQNCQKAGFRREATTQRQRAHKLDLQNRKLAATNRHQQMDIAALKSALKTRDNQLQALQEKLHRLESLLEQSKEAVDKQNADVVYERDELRDLLKATMHRLETVDLFINETLNNTSHLERKLEDMETQRSSALQAASKSRVLKKELVTMKKKLLLQSEALNKMADIQKRKNKRQKEAFQDIFQFDGSPVEAQRTPTTSDVLPMLDRVLGY